MLFAFFPGASHLATQVMLEEKDKKIYCGNAHLYDLFYGTDIMKLVSRGKN